MAAKLFAALFLGQDVWARGHHSVDVVQFDAASQAWSATALYWQWFEGDSQGALLSSDAISQKPSQGHWISSRATEGYWICSSGLALGCQPLLLLDRGTNT